MRRRFVPFGAERGFRRFAVSRQFWGFRNRRLLLGPPPPKPQVVSSSLSAPASVAAGLRQRSFADLPDCDKRATSFPESAGHVALACGRLTTCRIPRRNTNRFVTRLHITIPPRNLC